MKTTHKHTLEWSRKGRKRDNRRLRRPDRVAAITEGKAEVIAAEADPKPAAKPRRSIK